MACTENATYIFQMSPAQYAGDLVAPSKQLRVVRHHRASAQRSLKMLPSRSLATNSNFNETWTFRTCPCPVGCQRPSSVRIVAPRRKEMNNLICWRPWFWDCWNPPALACMFCSTGTFLRKHWRKVRVGRRWVQGTECLIMFNTLFEGVRWLPVDLLRFKRVIISN